MPVRLVGARKSGRPTLEWMLGESKKVGIIGTSRDSLQLAPWDDPSWVFWAHSSAVNVIPQGVAHVLIDTHPRACFEEGRKNGFEHYYKWLQRNTTPILMQQVEPDVPASIKFPRVRIKQQWDYHFGSQAASMAGLALYLGVKELGFWGVEYADGIERNKQRAHTLLWIGIAIGRGVRIVTAPNSRLLLNEDGDYGYDSHDTEDKRTALKQAFMKERNARFDPSKLQPVTPENENDVRALREEKQPEWAKHVATFGPEDKIPIELLQMEDRQREQAGRVAGVSAPEGLPRDHARLEGTPEPSGFVVPGRRSESGHEGSGPQPSDGLVQPSGDLVSAGAD